MLWPVASSAVLDAVPVWAMARLRPERSMQNGHNYLNDLGERFGL